MKRRSDDPFDLRFGVICNLYFHDILDEFFPGLAIWEGNPDGTLVYDSRHPLSDFTAKLESELPESYDSPFSLSRVKLYKELKAKAERNHAWWLANTGEYHSAEDFSRFSAIYDDHLPEWCCQKCGHINRLSLESIYGSDASWQNGQKPVDRDAFVNALKVRREEIRAGLTFRDGKPEDGPEFADMEEICFPPGERISRQVIIERAVRFPDQFLVGFDPSEKKIAGVIAGVATEKDSFTDDLFTDPSLHDPSASTIMITGLEVRPEYRQMGLATELMRRFIDRERSKGRKRIVLTCLDRLVPFYERMGYGKIGLSKSTLGGQAWYEMDMTL